MSKFLCFAAMLLLANVSQAQTETPSSASTAASSTADSAKLYGYTQAMPVKVGGGPRNQRAYLEKLRDAQGNKVTYERLGSCCPYKTDSPAAILGGGMLDIYEITCRDSNNDKKKVKVYITFYDFEEPKPIEGFTFGE